MVGSRWKFGDTPGASTTLQSAHASRCIASFGRPNVSDDVTDIANCKNYHRGTSPAVSRTGLFNPCASPGFESDTIAGNLDVSFNAKPQRQRCCYHSSMCAEFRQNFSNIHPRAHIHVYVYTYIYIFKGVFLTTIVVYRAIYTIVNIPTSLSINMDIQKKSTRICIKRY